MKKAQVIEAKHFQSKPVELGTSLVQVVGIGVQDELETIEKFPHIRNRTQTLLLPHDLPEPTLNRIWLAKGETLLATYDPEGRVHQLIFTYKLTYLILSDFWYHDPLLKKVRTGILSIDWQSMTLETVFQEKHRFTLPLDAKSELGKGGGWIPQGEYEIEYDSLLRVFNIYQPAHSFIQENSFGLPPRLVEKQATDIKIGYYWDTRFFDDQFVLNQSSFSSMENNNNNNNNNNNEGGVGIEIENTDDIQVMLL